MSGNKLHSAAWQPDVILFELAPEAHRKLSSTAQVRLDRVDGADPGRGYGVGFSFHCQDLKEG